LNDIYEWRNDSETILNSLSGLGVTLREHEKWFFEKMTDKDNFIGYISEYSEIEKIGFVFFARENFSAFEVSININPRFRHRGLSVQVLKKSIKCFSESQRSNIIARIKIKNIKSEKLFIRAGFKLNLSKSDNELKTYELVQSDI
jgi:L-amino acid N-acyltransferase YncA